MPLPWSLIVQLRAHSKCHSFAILLRSQQGQSSAWSDSACGSCESPDAWYHYHHKKSCFWDFQISSLKVGRYSCLKSFKWTACLLDCQGHLEIKKFWRNEKSPWSGRPSKRKERGCLFWQCRPDGAYGATCFVKRGNVILSYIRIQLTVILIFSTFISKGQILVLNQQGFSVLM